MIVYLSNTLDLNEIKQKNEITFLFKHVLIEFLLHITNNEFIEQIVDIDLCDYTIYYCAKRVNLTKGMTIKDIFPPTNYFQSIEELYDIVEFHKNIEHIHPYHTVVLHRNENMTFENTFYDKITFFRHFFTNYFYKILKPTMINETLSSTSLSTSLSSTSLSSKIFIHGAGPFGSLLLGALSGLLQKNVNKYHEFTGVSFGAVIATACVFLNPDDFFDRMLLFENIYENEINPMLSEEIIRNFIRTFLGDEIIHKKLYEIQQIVEHKGKKLKIIASNITDCIYEDMISTNPDMTLYDALICSCAIPIIIPFQTHGNKTYSDGVLYVHDYLQEHPNGYKEICINFKTAKVLYGDDNDDNDNDNDDNNDDNNLLTDLIHEMTRFVCVEKHEDQIIIEKTTDSNDFLHFGTKNFHIQNFHSGFEQVMMLS